MISVVFLVLIEIGIMMALQIIDDGKMLKKIQNNVSVVELDLVFAPFPLHAKDEKNDVSSK